MTDTPALLGHLDLIGDDELKQLLADKIKIKNKMEQLISLQSQVDKEIKDKLGAYSSFSCGDYYGTYRFEPRKAYEVKSSSPRVLRIEQK